MKKYDNFVNALEKLTMINNYDEPYDDLQINGLVHLYEVCFEQSWKAMKEILEDGGFDMALSGSPKQIIKTAYSAGMISNEDIWLEALKARNDVTHSYNEEIAMDIIHNTKDKFLGMFLNLKDCIERNWAPRKL